MNLELRIWIWPGFSVSVCGCVGWVCGGVVWERIGCRWLHAFLPQQEGEQAPVIYGKKIYYLYSSNGRGGGCVNILCRLSVSLSNEGCLFKVPPNQTHAPIK